MKNVNFIVANGVTLEIRNLRGELMPTKPGVPVTFNDVSSFQAAIDTAEVALSTDSLTTLLNTSVLASEGAPIRNVAMSIEDGKIKQKGTIHKGVNLEFEIEGTLSPTASREIRMHADKIKSEHIPVKCLLHFFGDDLSNLVNRNAGRGMRIEGDDIILIPAALTPPPHMTGRVTRVELEAGKIVQYFDSGKHQAPLRPAFASNAYIYHRGGVIRFGKLTMRDADLEIVGDRKDVFNFFQKQYSSS
ncbi:MAG TPA: hypothetical protein VHW24_04145 [Bryobacteraceae bacterium]|nr:hypothetical protein [Bryobacteraceae bacterium]